MTRRYGAWAGAPVEYPERVEDCVVEVSVGRRNALFHQCGRRRGHGPLGLYCRQHARMLAAGRQLSVPPDE